MSRTPWLNDALAAAASAKQVAEKYALPIPSDEAIELAAQIIRALAAHPDLPAPHVSPGVDPGIGITMRRGKRGLGRLSRWLGRTLYVEVGSDAEVAFCVIESKGLPKAVDAEPAQFAEYAADAARFLLEGVPVPWEG